MPQPRAQFGEAGGRVRHRAGPHRGMHQRRRRRGRERRRGRHPCRHRVHVSARRAAGARGVLRPGGSHRACAGRPDHRRHDHRNGPRRSGSRRGTCREGRGLRGRTGRARCPGGRERHPRDHRRRGRGGARAHRPVPALHGCGDLALRRGWKRAGHEAHEQHARLPDGLGPRGGDGDSDPAPGSIGRRYSKSCPGAPRTAT